MASHKRDVSEMKKLSSPPEISSLERSVITYAVDRASNGLLGYKDLESEEMYLKNARTIELMNRKYKAMKEAQSRSDKEEIEEDEQMIDAATEE